MICAKCKATNPDGLKFCNECGSTLKALCASCGFENAPTAKFCGDCGLPIGESATTAGKQPGTSTIGLIEAADTEALDGERKTVTALFADLKGSTELLETLDPEEGRAIVEPLLRIMSDAVRRYQGYLVRTTGDGVFALFGAPVAYEDHPQRALHAALQMQQELSAYERTRTAEALPALEARVGVHTGQVVAYPGEASGKVEYRLIGHTANLAARMESIAAVGAIAVSEATAKLCEGYFELRELGPMTVKGVSAPVRVYEVLGPGRLRNHFELSTRRGLTPFVGRERELEQIRRALEQSMAGHGQIAAVVAEAGTGKSRLFYEFKGTIPAECKVLEAYSLSHGKSSAWLPVLEFLHGYFGITEADNAAAQRDKVRNALTALDQALEDILPYLFGLLGIVDGPDPHAQMNARLKRQRTLDAIKRIILRDSLQQPVVIIFEDLHWIDEQTQRLLDLLADSVASARMLLLFNYRPEYHHGWANKSYYSQLRLDPLAGADGAAMLGALVGKGDELNVLKRLIAERTGGNPFFIEEIVQGLFEEGTLVRNGMVRIARSLSQLRLPPTVQGMLAARVDRLPRPQKDLLQTLAVIGREARLRLVRQVTSSDEVLLIHNLADLCAAEFIYEQPVVGDTEFVFKHALTQEVAYGSLLIERRKPLHEHVGYSTETLFADKLDDHLDALAYHYSHSDNPKKAIEYLSRAGQQAMRRSAHDQAIRNLNGAIERLRGLPESRERDTEELALQLSLGSVMLATQGWSAAAADTVYGRAKTLAERMSTESVQILYGMHANSISRGELRAAHLLGLRMLQIANSTNNSSALVLARQNHGLTQLTLGELCEARSHLLQAVESSREEDFPDTPEDPGGAARTWLGVIEWLLGYPDRATQRTEEARAYTRRLNKPFAIAYADMVGAWVDGITGNFAGAVASARNAEHLGTELGFPFFSAGSKIVRYWASANAGETVDAVECIRAGIAELDAINFFGFRNVFLTLLAETQALTGELDAALTSVQEALEGTPDELWYRPLALTLRGELLQRSNTESTGSLTSAEQDFREAIDLSRRMGAKSPELRATGSLARLLRDTGRHAEAHTALAEIYNRFTEGFGTSDLKTAKALLSH
jgi:class 3 adenylate cyclase/tetratricopeptide (TPR) repeat protein